MKSDRQNLPAGLEQDLVKELEKQCTEQISKLRTHERLDIQVEVKLFPGNASDHAKGAIIARSIDISRGGCAVTSTVPVAVGDIFRLSFEAPELDLPQVVARCLRCRMLRDDAFEAGFRFFSEISLTQEPRPEKTDLL